MAVIRPKWTCIHRKKAVQGSEFRESRDDNLDDLACTEVVKTAFGPVKEIVPFVIQLAALFITLLKLQFEEPVQRLQVDVKRFGHYFHQSGRLLS